MNKLVAIFGLLLSLLLVNNVQAEPQSPFAQVIQKLEKSVFQLDVYKSYKAINSRTKIASGSGFAVESTNKRVTIVTAKHVVDIMNRTTMDQDGWQVSA